MSYEQPTYEELARDTLGRMMCDFSEDFWCAGWMMDLEFTLWEALTAGSRRLGMGRLEEREIVRMKRLHGIAGGWWAWSKEEGGERFVTTEEWLKILDQKMQSKAAGPDE